jgi:hypothetical protein
MVPLDSAANFFQEYFIFRRKNREKWKNFFYDIIIFRYKFFFRNKKRMETDPIIQIFPLLLIFTIATTFFATEKYGVSEPVFFKSNVAVNKELYTYTQMSTMVRQYFISLSKNNEY